MRIFVNGDQHEVKPRTLALALEELGYRSKKIATAVNGRFIAAALRPDTPLAEGDKVEVVAPMQGG
jgi:sulfur carrier protein